MVSWPPVSTQANDWQFATNCPVVGQTPFLPLAGDFFLTALFKLYFPVSASPKNLQICNKNILAVQRV